MKVKYKIPPKIKKKSKLLMILCTSSFTIPVPAWGIIWFTQNPQGRCPHATHPLFDRNLWLQIYNIAKFLVPFLQPLTINNYTVKDSFSFVDEITSLTTNSHNYGQFWYKIPVY